MSEDDKSPKKSVKKGSNPLEDLHNTSSQHPQFQSRSSSNDRSQTGQIKSQIPRVSSQIERNQDQESQEDNSNK